MSVELAALDRAIAQTLADAVIAAVAPGAAPEAYSTARDAAQMLALDGLDHALGACSAHAGTHLPPDVLALADRLGRLAAAAREAGDLTPLREADATLAALADELNGYEWAAAGDPDSASRTAVPTLLVADVLDDVPLAGDDSRAVARRSMLPVPVAAAVRAAIDWLTHTGAGAPVRLHGEPSLLELRLERIRTDRLSAAHRVLADAGGNLGPAGDGAGWVLRVPSFAERPTFLMLVQGGLRIAVPWHAVLKLRIVATRSGPGAMWPAEYPVLPSLAPPDPESPEHPIVLIGHGLKRAYLVVDRLIWRMTADVCENEWGSPGGGLHETVRTEDGEVFWVADPGRLLADVELPEIATEEVTPELSAADVQPLGDETEIPTLAIAPAEAAAPEPEPPPTSRALIADDSLTTRLLLTRLLEQHGFTVEAVPTAADLIRRLNEAAWNVVFADLDLPDGSGAEWLATVNDVAASRPYPVHVVALVRDGRDLDVARAAGLEDSLLKPFARESLAALLERHGWMAH